MILHGYWRSTASYRVRIALNLKGLAYRHVTHDLRTAAHRQPAYTALNAQGMVPMIEQGETRIAQSMAIMEWLDECHPEVPLLPCSPDERATVRAMAMLIACDIHPINNLRVLDALRRDYGADAAQVKSWIARWIGDGFTALEQWVARHGSGFTFGDHPTMADCCLVPQLYAARRFGVDVEPFPLLCAVDRAAALLPAFALAHPDRQPDADA